MKYFVWAIRSLFSPIFVDFTWNGIGSGHLVGEVFVYFRSTTVFNLILKTHKLPLLKSLLPYSLKISI